MAKNVRSYTFSTQSRGATSLKAIDTASRHFAKAILLDARLGIPSFHCLITIANAPSVCGKPAIDGERVTDHEACAGAAQPKDS